MKRRKKAESLRLPDAERNIRPEERVYCNRQLKMSRIRALGFDMDHTIGIYRPEIEDLAYKLTIEKMIERGYPPSLRDLVYDRHLAIRGLVVDKETGNLIKIDRYKYTTSAYHGTRKLSWEERKGTYSNRRLDLASPGFHNLDTLFTIPEAVLYAQMVDLADAVARPPAWEYRKIFDDIRASIDTAHRDGTLKSLVTADLPRYFEPDPLLPETLARFRAAGKKVFLLTNSELEYTDKVMSFLFDAGTSGRSWKQSFDLIAVSARKPGFFMEGTPLELIETGDRFRIMTGGNVEKLEALLGVVGEEVLYFGDHTYGDIMRSKKYSLWRTAMVVEELEHEFRAARKTRRMATRLERLYLQKSKLQDDLALQQEALDLMRARKLGEGGPKPGGGALQAIDKEIVAAERRLRALDKRLTRNLIRIKELEKKIRHAYNPYWGPLFRAGTEMSRIADQIEDFACLYTSRVSNFLNYPVNRYFMSVRERMVHEVA